MIHTQYRRVLSMKRIVCILLTGWFLACSCMREAMPEMVRVSLQIGQPEAMDSMGRIDSKSYLTASDIETRISSVTVGIFEADGTQAYLGYHTGNFGSLDITLRSDRTYNIYTLANMGDRRSPLVTAVSNGMLSSMTYTVDYSSMASAGIPMVGAVNGQVFTEGQAITVPLQRLLARINVSLSCDWSGAVITSATVKNVNPTVSPFGTAPASSTNRPTLQDIHGTLEGSASTLTAVFYVPENTQGTVGSITSSWQKTYSNNALSSIRDYATYLETLVSTTGQYTGSVVYRSYLGANQTTDFNILRNQIYRWTITYHEENLLDYDWKRAADMNDPASISIYPWQFDGSETDYVGYNKRASVTASYSNTGPSSGFTSYADNLNNCTSSDFTYGNDGATVWVYWNSANSSSTERRVNIYLRDPESGAEDFLRCSQDGHTTVETHSLVVSGGDSFYWFNGGGCQLTATYYTTTDGVTDSGTDVTSSATWTRINGSENLSVSSSGYVSATGAGTATFQASYKGCTDSNICTAKDFVEHSLVVSGGDSFYWYNGGRCQLTATYYTTTDGVTDSGTDVTSSATWTRINGSTNLSISSSGNVTATGSGTSTFRASYNGCSDSDSCTAKDFVEHNLVISGATSVDVGETVPLTATYYTTINGISDGGNDVTHLWNCSWSCTGVGSVNNSTGAHKGNVTSSAPGTAHVSASYSGESDTHDIQFNSVTPTYLYKVVTTLSPSELYVGNQTSASAALYRSSDGGSNWTYQSDVTGSGFTAVSGGSHVSISGSTLTAISSGSATIRSKYGANTYDDAGLAIWDSYEMEVSGSTSALRTSSISLTATLRKNGSPVSATFNYSWISGGSYANVSKSGSVFTISASNNRSCKWNGMDHYTLRLQVNTDAHTGTLSQDVDIVFEPTAWTITIGLRYESGSSFTTSSCTYYAEASEIVPPEAQYIPLTATDNYGNHWAFDSIDHTMITATQVNPGGFNPYGNASLAKSLHIISISPSSLYSKSWDSDYTFQAGSTQAH